MAVKNKQELKIKLDNVITQNNNNEITGTIQNDILTDFIDSFQVESGVVNAAVYTVNQTVKNPVISGSNTSVIIVYLPKGEVNILINGIKFQVGSTNQSAFFFMKDSILQDKMNIASNSVLYYNSTVLGFTLDSNDIIELNYIK